MDDVPHADTVVSRRAAPPGFEEFYAAELPRLVSLARALCGSAAEDVAQEAMLAAYRRWREVRDLDHPEMWVRRTCSNIAVSYFRRRVVELRATARFGGRRVPQPELAPDTDAFWAAVRRLPRRQGQAAALRYVYDLPVAEIAATLECTPGTVKQHLSRARRALARDLGVEDES